MIVCPNCKNEEFDGILFCSKCGVQMPNVPIVATQSIQKPTEQLPGKPGTSPVKPPPTGPLESPVSLYVMDAGQIVPLIGRDEFSIGRVSDGQTILPDVDLGPFQAYEKGVSRLHASIRISSTPVTLVDLGSVNGTRLNGHKIPPSQPAPLSHGDIITLGKLKIQMIIRR
jgi:pSer/pThr/pTyr-binding forkhead associated (FHA) protein